MSTATPPAPGRKDGARDGPARPAPARPAPSIAPASVGGWAALATRAPIQTKLEVGAAGDSFEREADHTADRVMRMPAGPIQRAPAARIQRCSGCTAGALCPSCAKKEEERARRLPDGPGPAGGVVPDSTERAVAGMRGGGTPLPAESRGFFEPRFGRDFGAVRLHTGPGAADAARSLGARAFATGPDVYLGAGQSTSGPAGQRLLAHELTHVAQQGYAPALGGSAAPASAAPARLQRESPAVETEVDDEQLALEGLPEGAIPVEETRLVSNFTEGGGGANLRAAPDTAGDPIERLPPNTRLFVDHEAPGGWYNVYLDDGRTGWVAKRLVSNTLPDPEARLHRIRAGESALDIVRQYYTGDAIGWGHDQRFYVNVLVHVNEARGLTGIRKPASADWEGTVTVADQTIWIPGLAFATDLRGVVDVESTSYKVVDTIKNFVIGYFGFIIGFLHGALESLVDVFVGLYDLAMLAWSVFESWFKGTLAQDASELAESLSKITLEDVKRALGEWYDEKWNSPSTWTRWHYRGWLTGYVVMELVMLYFSAGALTIIKWAGKAGKIAKWFAKLPAVARMLTRVGKIGGKKADELRAALKAATKLSAAHAWAAEALRIPIAILQDLSEEAIERLRKLPGWARERFADLNYEAKRLILGCHSPCKVNVKEILEDLENLATAGVKGTRLTGRAGVLAALPSGMKTGKIAEKLKSRPALMKAIEAAELTDADFKALRHFLTDADKMSEAAAYRTFVRYLTNVVPAKLKGDIGELNKLADELVAADPRQGAALKGAMFEVFARVNVAELATAEKKLFPKSLGLKKARTADGYVKETGEIWDMKHSKAPVPKDQALDYRTLLNLGKTPDGDAIKAVNYLFPSEEMAKASLYLKSPPYSFAVYYIKAGSNTLVQL